MATWLRKNSDQDIKIGPFVSDADGFTPLTSLTIAQADVRLSLGGGDWIQPDSDPTVSHDENGWYNCSLIANDVSQAGRLVVAIAMSGALPVWHEFLVVTGNTYDSLVNGDISVGAALDPSSVNEIAGAVWDTDFTLHAGAFTFGLQVGSLTFTVAGQVDSNVQAVNDTTVTGSGTGGDPWGP